MISQHFPPSYTSIYREFLSFSLHPLPFRETPQVLPGAFTNSGSNLTEMSTKSKAGGQFAKASSSGHPKYMNPKMTQKSAWKKKHGRNMSRKSILSWRLQFVGCWELREQFEASNATKSWPGPSWAILGQCLIQRKQTAQGQLLDMKSSGGRLWLSNQGAVQLVTQQTKKVGSFAPSVKMFGWISVIHQRIEGLGHPGDDYGVVKRMS